MADKEKRLTETECKALSLSALGTTLRAAEKGLESLPDYGGTEPDVVKGARGMLLGIADSAKEALTRIDERVEG